MQTVASTCFNLTAELMVRTQNNAAGRYELIYQLETTLREALKNNNDAQGRVTELIDLIRQDFAFFDDKIAPLVHAAVIDINFIIVENLHKKHNSMK